MGIAAASVGPGIIGRGIRRMLDMAVPPQCLVCEAIVDAPGGCCAKCWRDLRRISRPYCEVMGTPFSYDLGEGTLSAEAIADPPPFARLRSAVLYDDAARRLVTGLKYSDRLDLAPWLAGWMGIAASELIADRPLVVPIPLHRFRRLHRRFNQSAELARHLAHMTGLEFAPEILIRHRRTRKQVGLTGSQRARNLQGAFRVPVGQRPRARAGKFLLIDDVYTSGATAKAAARALKRAGAARIDVLTFARVETHTG